MSDLGRFNSGLNSEETTPEPTIVTIKVYENTHEIPFDEFDIERVKSIARDAGIQDFELRIDGDRIENLDVVKAGDVIVMSKYEKLGA